MANPNQQNNNQQNRSEETHPAAQQSMRTGTGEKRFRVKEEAKIARGGSCYTLTKGKTISSHGYDIKALISQGVQLEQIEEVA